MATPDALLQSMLEAAPGLGQPSGLLEPQVVGAGGGMFKFDFAGMPGVKPAAEKLLSPGAWQLLQHLSREDVEAVTVHYYLERIGADLSTPNTRRTVVAYPPPSARSRTALTRYGAEVSMEALTGSDATQSLRSYAERSNFPVMPGIGGEHFHLHVARMHKDIRQTLVVMWLMHLDIVAGADLTMTLDPAQLHAGVRGAQSQAAECEYAKTTGGVRLHVNAVDATTKALLVAACDPGMVNGRSARTRRYDWEVVPLTLYGGILPVAQNVILANADATARAIISFSEQYATQQECSAALHTALLLYGAEDLGTRVPLLLGAPSLHGDAHRTRILSSGIAMVRELAGRELAALAMFLARSYAQSAAAALRTTVLAVGAKDLPGADAYLVAVHQHLLWSAGEAFGREWEGLYPSFIHHGACVYINVNRLWAQTGVLHCLMAGIVVEGAVVSEVAGTFTTRALVDTAVTDNPAAGEARADEAVTWYILSQLLQDGGEGLAGSRAAIKRALTQRLQLHPDTRQFACTTSRLVIAGLGSPVFLNPASEDRPVLALPPNDPAVAVPPPASGPVLAANSAAALKPLAPEEDWVQSLVTHRGPIASTTMRRQKAPAMRGALHAKEAIVVAEVPGPAREAVDRAAACGWGPEPTSGEGMLCGARAIQASLDAMAKADEEIAPLLDTVITAIQGALTPEQRALMEAADVPVTLSDFTVDQLALGVRRLGRYQLGVIESTNGRGTVRVYGPDDPEAETVLIHHDGRGHWSSIGPGGGKRVRRESTRQTRPPTAGG